MIKHTAIRAAVMDALSSNLGRDVVFFDGRPAVLNEEDFPAVAVYITDARYTGEVMDEDSWRAVLHIELFLPAQVPDSELDEWMETKIYPAFNDVPGLDSLITEIIPQGYSYQRDDELASWSSADLSYQLIYSM
ncbi:Phage minor tail protein U [Serratia rubidaea]|uniref:Phage minor tail protein U n=1 Tax=Serratia rubidaea TaxID=61652 RepID=A0A3S5DET7_SERRU|nr:Phage minor tail protein U [Serratia rubidaea]